MPPVITGVSAWISTQPLESVNATPASTGRRVSCAGQGDSGLTVSVGDASAPVFSLLFSCVLPILFHTILLT